MIAVNVMHCFTLLGIPVIFIGDCQDNPTVIISTQLTLAAFIMFHYAFPYFRKESNLHLFMPCQSSLFVGYSSLLDSVCMYVYGGKAILK